MYRPVRIKVERCMGNYMAHAVLQDDGLSESDPTGEPCPFVGLDLEQGPYFGWTHKRAWKKALKAVGGKLWPERP